MLPLHPPQPMTSQSLTCSRNGCARKRQRGHLNVDPMFVKSESYFLKSGPSYVHQAVHYRSLPRRGRDSAVRRTGGLRSAAAPNSLPTSTTTAPGAVCLAGDRESAG